jgi:hypothetical protein
VHPGRCASLVTHCSKSSGQNPESRQLGRFVIVPCHSRHGCVVSVPGCHYDRRGANAHLQIGNNRSRYGDAVASESAVAEAADVPPAYWALLAPPFYNWTRLYVGIHAGAEVDRAWFGLLVEATPAAALSVAGRSDATGLEVELAGTSAKKPSAYPA